MESKIMPRDPEHTRELLAALSAPGALEMLLRLRKGGRMTASEMAADMDMHVATAVKRLKALHALELLGMRVRKGRTRSALEYKLACDRIEITLDLGMLAGGSEGGALEELLDDIIGRLERFSGRTVDDMLGGELRVPGKNASNADVAAEISRVLDAGAMRFGARAMTSLARASLDSVESAGRVKIDRSILPTRYFPRE